jgi:hypothetical protein
MKVLATIFAVVGLVAFLSVATMSTSERDPTQVSVDTTVIAVATTKPKSETPSPVPEQGRFAAEDSVVVKKLPLATQKPEPHTERQSLAIQAHTVQLPSGNYATADRIAAVIASFDNGVVNAEDAWDLQFLKAQPFIDAKQRTRLNIALRKAVLEKRVTMACAYMHRC